VARSLRIHNHLEEPIRLHSIAATPEVFTVESSTAEITAGGHIDLGLVAQGADRSGTHSGHLTALTDASVMPSLRVPLHLEVESRISLEPANVWLGFLEPDQTASRSVEISAPGIPGFQVTGLELSEPGLTAEITASGEGITTVSVSADASQREAGLINTELAVQTNDPAEPVLRIDVLGTVRPNRFR
jgi:hypothetical protein